MLTLILIGAMYVDVKRKKCSESYLKRMFKGSKARAPAPPERVVEPSIYGSGEREKNQGGIRTIWNNSALHLLCLKLWTKK